MSSSSSFFSGTNPTPTEYQTAVNLVAQATQQATAALASQEAAATSAQSAQGYSTAAGSSATSAANQASSAATSSAGALTYKTAAETAATNAASSATNAANSAASVLTSETNASNSASAAGTSATAAATSATNAASSSTAAGTSATNASNSASAASTSATNAANSATAAAGSASTATTQATTATNQAATATTQATNAANSATAAGTSATNAANSATAASTSATNAATSATNAASSATAASGSASAASTSATDAATSASNAASTLAGALTKTDNLASLSNVGTARTNLGLTALATTTPGTNVATALGVNVGTAGSVVVNGGALGTPSSGTLTNATGLPISSGVSGLGTGVGTFLATPSSANLASAVTDETGTGALVFANSPTLVTPVLGTPASGNLANCTFPTLNQNTSGTAAGLSSTLVVGSGGTGTGTAFTTGSVVFAGASGVYSQNNSGLFWDNTNARLGLGTTSPSHKLDILIGGGTALTSVARFGALGNGAAGRGVKIILSPAGSNSQVDAVELIGYQQGASTTASNAAFAINVADSTGTMQQRLFIDNTGNLGLGVTPSAWSSSGNLELGASGSIVAGGTGIYLGQNWYYGSAAFRYKTTQAATYYLQSGGLHQWFNAPSGTAGTAITFTQAMTLDASGNLALGTTDTSLGRMAVVGADNSTIMQVGGTNRLVKFNTSANGPYANGWFNFIHTSSVGGYTFQTNNGGTTIMTMDNGGNVGIGTTSPGYKLDVQNGNMRLGATGSLQKLLVYGDEHISNNNNWNYSDLNLIRTASNTASIRRLAFMLGGDSDSNTTVGGYNAIWSFYNATPTSTSTSAALQGQMVYASYSGHQWYINGSEKARIDSSGNLAIGSTTAYGKLDVLGNGNANSLHITNSANTDTGAYINATGAAECMFSGGATYNSYSAPNFVMNAKSTVASGVYIQGSGISFWVNTGLTAGTTFNQTERMSISSAGVIRFNNYGAGSLSTSATGVISASDGRYKDKTRSLNNGLSFAMALQPTYYRWKESSPFHSDDEELGFIAQEVANVIPEASPELDAPDKFRNYYDRAILAVAVKAIQELAAKVAELEAKI